MRGHRRERYIGRLDSSVVEKATLPSGFVNKSVAQRVVSQIYRCYRSSLQLEGYHLHLRQILCAGQISCSPRLLHALSTLFDFRWNTKSAVKAKLLQDSGHYALYLVDELYDIVQSASLEPSGLLIQFSLCLNFRLGGELGLISRASEAA